MPITADQAAAVVLDQLRHTPLELAVLAIPQALRRHKEVMVELATQLTQPQVEAAVAARLL